MPIPAVESCIQLPNPILRVGAVLPGEILAPHTALGTSNLSAGFKLLPCRPFWCISFMRASGRTQCPLRKAIESDKAAAGTAAPPPAGNPPHGGPSLLTASSLGTKDGDGQPEKPVTRAGNAFSMRRGGTIRLGGDHHLEERSAYPICHFSCGGSSPQRSA